MIPYSTAKLNALKKENNYEHFVYALKDDKTKDIQQLIVVKYYNLKSDISDVIVLNFNKNDVSKISILSDIIVSKKAKISDLKWDLYNNTKYIIKYDGVYEKVQTPEQISILHGNKANITKQLMDFNLKRDREFSNKELKHYLKILKDEEIHDLYALNFNFYLQRIFHSAMCIVFAILGCLLGYCNPREQKLIGFTIAVGIIFLYYMSLQFFNLMAEKSILIPWITATIQPFLIGVLIYYYKKYKGL